MPLSLVLLSGACAGESGPRLELREIGSAVDDDARADDLADAGARTDDAERGDALGYDDAMSAGGDGALAVEDARDADAHAGADADSEVSARDAAADDASLAPDASVHSDAAAGLDAPAPVDAGDPRPDFVIEGFGAQTRGGWRPGHDEVWVTSLADSGPGTLREALATSMGPRIIRFTQSGTIALASSLLVPSDTTIDGRGHHVTLRGKGLVLAGSDDVIVTHLTLLDVGPDSEDGVRIGDPTLGPSERVVLDHLTLRATGDNGDSARVDEAISIIFGSRDITLAWLRVEAWEKVLLIGNGDAPAAIDGAITVSWHHSLCRGTGRRHPQVRFGVVDMWNVFLDDWHMYDWLFVAPFRESFGAQAQQGARVRLEASLFRRTPQAYDLGSQANDATRCESGGTLDGLGLVTVPSSTAPLRFGAGCTGGTGWLRPYTVTLDAADEALRLRLEAEAGNVR